MSSKWTSPGLTLAVAVLVGWAVWAASQLATAETAARNKMDLDLTTFLSWITLTPQRRNRNPLPQRHLARCALTVSAVVGRHARSRRRAASVVEPRTNLAFASQRRRGRQRDLGESIGNSVGRAELFWETRTSGVCVHL